MLSHGAGGIRRELEGRPRWDRELSGYLAKRPYPVVDLRDVHRRDFASWKGSLEGYLARYFIGHYAPAGNFLTAEALRPVLVEWLSPKPPAYRAPGTRDRAR